MKKIIPTLMCIFFPIVLFILLFSSNNVNASNLHNNYSIVKSSQDSVFFCKIKTPPAPDDAGGVS